VYIFIFAVAFCPLKSTRYSVEVSLLELCSGRSACGQCIRDAAGGKQDARSFTVVSFFCFAVGEGAPTACD
jgi:hypothetical protein